MSDLIRILSSQGKPLGETRKLADGTPVRSFKRYLAKVGGVYRKLGWPQAWEVTDAERAHLLSTWNEMQAVGHPVKITVDHRNPDKAENIVGDATDIGVEQVGKDHWIYATMDIRGEKNIAIAEANKDASVEVWPEVVTGSGRNFKHAIKAITFTPIPIVGSQPIAASTADDSPYLLSTEIPMKAVYDAIAKLAGVDGSSVNESNAVGHIDAHIAKCTAMKMSLEAAEAKVLKLSTEAEPDIRYLSLAARTGESALDALAKEGVCDVQTVEGLKRLAVGTKDGDKRSFSKIALLLSTQGDEAPINFCETLATLMRNNKPMKMSTTTTAQHRHVPDSDPQVTGPRKVKSPYTGAEIEINV